MLSSARIIASSQRNRKKLQTGNKKHLFRDKLSCRQNKSFKTVEKKLQENVPANYTVTIHRVTRSGQLK